MIDAQSITSRMMMTSTSTDTAATLVRKYLSAFGIVPPLDLSTYPPVFKDTHVPEWRAFTKQYANYVKNDPERNALYTILEFLRYMKHMGINPFIKRIKAPASVRTRAKIELQAVYTNLLEASLGEIAQDVMAAVRKTHILTVLSASSSRIAVSKNDGRHVLYAAYTLKTKRKTDSLDGVLTRLQGFLFSSTDVPIQLRDAYQKLSPTSKVKAKSIRFPAPRLMHSTARLGWLIAVKNARFSIYVIRSKNDNLVMRIEVPLKLDLDIGHAVNAVIVKAWKTAVSSLK
jgi:hypothetical protein